MTKEDKNYVHIVFDLQPDAHGWPPVGSERMWAMKTGEGEYRLESVPFYVRGVSYGDIVSASEKEEHGILFFDKVLKDSGHFTIRLLIQDENDNTDNVLKSFLRQNGADIENVRKGFFAVDIPPSSDIEKIREYLKEGEEKGDWAYEEGKVPT